MLPSVIKGKELGLGQVELDKLSKGGGNPLLDSLTTTPEHISKIYEQTKQRIDKERVSTVRITKEKVACDLIFSYKLGYHVPKSELEKLFKEDTNINVPQENDGEEPQEKSVFDSLRRTPSKKRKKERNRTPRRFVS